MTIKIVMITGIASTAIQAFNPTVLAEVRSQLGQFLSKFRA